MTNLAHIIDQFLMIVFYFKKICLSSMALLLIYLVFYKALTYLGEKNLKYDSYCEEKS